MSDLYRRGQTAAGLPHDPCLTTTEIRELEAQILYLAVDVRRVSSAAEAFLRSAAGLLEQQLLRAARDGRERAKLVLVS
jgi:hypothetical protein